MMIQKIGDLCEQIRGVTYSKGEAQLAPQPGLLPVLRANNITDQGLVFDDLVYVPSSRIADKQRIRQHDIVIAASSGSLTVVGKAAVVHRNFDGSFGAFCKVLRPNTRIHPGYFAHFFKTQDYRRRVSALAEGANINNLRNEHLDELEIPVPSDSQQQRIAAILDAADALREKRRQAIAKLDGLVQGVFTDLFGDPIVNSKGWKQAKLSTVVEGKYGIKAGPFGSSLKKEDYSTSGYRVYGQEQVIAGRFDVGDYYIDESKFQKLQACAVKEGDLLVSLVGSFGKVLIVPAGIEPGIINPRLLKITPDQSVLTSNFLAALLTHSAIQGEFERMSHGGTMGILNAGLLKQVQTILPPISLQHSFASRVALVERQKQYQHQSMTLLDTLFTSLQQRAFRGELLP